MRNFMMKLDKASENPPAGGASNVPPATEPPKNDTSPATPPPSKESKENLDDFGYENEPAAPESKEKAPKDDKKPQDDKSKSVPKIEDIKAPATGYTQDPPKLEDPPSPKKDETPPPPPDEIEKTFEGLPKEEITKVREFLGKNKVEPEVLKAFAEMRKKEFADAKAYAEQKEREAQQEIIRTRAQWHDELKKDPVFGGEKFQTNVVRAEKILDEFMPNTKKVLTERKGVLPPWVMRDLALLADHLYPETRLVQGDPPQKEEQEEEKDDALSFYE